MREREAEEKLQQELLKQQVGQIQSHFYLDVQTLKHWQWRGARSEVFSEGAHLSFQFLLV